MTDDEQFRQQIEGDAKRTVLCEPHRLDEIQAAVQQRGLTDTITVRASRLCPTGKLLVLDDSTSAVDVETEAKLQAALAATKESRTTFVVAQRISTVLEADTILVLEKGRIVAEGTHAELIVSSPVYREIYDSQLGGAPAPSEPAEGTTVPR